MQGTILVFALLGLFLIADFEQFVAQASAIPGSAEEKTAIQTGKVQTEIYPLTLFAVAGMMLFPAASDLITLFVALEGSLTSALFNGRTCPPAQTALPRSSS
jgi:NADH-quinone oxidoreductase subunit N